MKKNLRIVSAAAAALLAVAPVAATAVSTADAATVVNAGSAINTNTNAKYDVDVTPSISAVAAVAANTTTNTPAIAGNLTGTISASYNGKSYTANLKTDAENATITEGTSTTAVKPADLKANTAYTVTVKDVSFNFGSENAGKTITLGSANSNVKFTGVNSDEKTETNVSTLKVKLDQNGVASLKNVSIANVYAINTTDNSNVNFYDVTTGTNVTTGSVSVNADNQGQVNISSVVAAINSKYFAAQYANKNLNTVKVNVENAVKDALKAANIESNAVGYFKAPSTLTVNLKATSNTNGKSATLPVTVTVPNAISDSVQSTSKTIMHASYYYNKEGKRVGTDKIGAYNTVTVVPTTVKLADGKTYYQVVENGKAVDKYINASNIDGTKRTLKKNAYVYKNNGKAKTHKVGKKTKKVLVKKGTEVTTYGAKFNINGKAYYRIGRNNEYVKVANF